jgi:protein-disulfide isomerase
VLVAITAAGAAKKIAPEGSQAREVSAEVRSLLGGIPQDGDVLGRIDAPVTLQYFGDLECPVCKAFTVGALPSIIRNWVRAGRLRIEYHSLETATREPEVFTDQQSAALAAGKQDRMWNFIETFYHEQGEEDSGYVTEGYIQGIAKQVPGLNLTKWQAERADPGLAAQLEDDARTASVHNLNGTPAFLIGLTGRATKQLEPNALTEAAPFEQAIAKLAGSARS